ncbi:MAG: hypothetical protein KKF42_04390 [Actinobacteria bacterium]|nr:hypothetical protein [Actinomycetota bacterium]
MTVEVGKVAIRAIPDTKGFRDKLERALNKDARTLPPIQVRANIERVNINRQKVRKNLQAQFEKLRGLRVDVDVNANVKRLRGQLGALQEEAGTFDIVASFDRAAILRVNREIQDLVKDIEIDVDIDTDAGRNVRRMVNDLEQQLRDLNQMSLFEGLDDADFEYLHSQMAQVRREIDRVRHAASRADEQLDDLAEDRTVRLDVNPFTAWASARLAWLSRPRVVEIIPRVSKAALVQAATAIAALSGARLTWTYLDKFVDWMKVVDKRLPGLTFGALGLSNAFSAILGAVAGIVGIGDGLAAMLPSLLLLPGLFAGAALSAVALFVALKHSKTELAGLGDDYNELGGIIRAAFWDDARPAIIDFSNSIMPQLMRSFDKTSRAMGRFTARLAGSLKREFAGGRLEAMFDGLVQAWDNLSTGTDAFARAITNLGLVAARYMPALANWFVRQSITFDNWLADVAADGRLDQWIKESVEAFYALWDVTAATTGIFQGLWKAASAAGYEGLRGFADMLLGWEKAVQGAKWQRTLTAMFTGARKAMQALGDGLEKFGLTLDYLRTDIEYVLGETGEILGRFIGKVSEAFRRPEVADGMRRFVDGIGAGLRGLEPALGPLAAMFGTLAGFIGDLAAQLGPVLGEALLVLAPAFTDIMNALAPLLPQLSTAMVEAIRELAPLVADLTVKFIDALPGIIDFVEGVIRAAPEMLPFIVAGLVMATVISKLIEWLTPLVTWIMNNKDEMGKLGAVAGGLVGTLVRVFTWVALIATILIGAWQNSGRFRESVERLGDQLGKIIDPLVEMAGALFGSEVATDGLLGIIGHLLSYLVDVVSIIFGSFVPGLEYSAAAIGGLAEGISKFLAGDWTGGWESITTGFQSASDRQTEAVQNWMGDIGGLFTYEQGDEWGNQLGDGTSSGYANSLTTDGVDLAQFALLGENAAYGFYSGVATDPANADLAPWLLASGIDTAPFSLAGAEAKDAFTGGLKTPSLMDYAFKPAEEIETVSFSTKGQEAGGAFNAAFSSSVSGTVTMPVPQVDMAAFTRSGTTAGESFEESLLRAFSSINLTDSGTKIVDTVTNGFNSRKPNAVSAARAIGTESKSALSSASSGSYSIGVSFGSGFADGIRSEISSAARAAADLAAAAMSSAKAELDINSPSKKARDILGKGVGEGYALGLVQSIPLVRRSMQSMVDLAGARVGAPSLTNVGARLVSFAPNPMSGSGITNNTVEAPVTVNMIERDPERVGRLIARGLGVALGGL